MRERVGIERTILCATRFWSLYRERSTRGPTLPTLYEGVRQVVTKQGYKSADMRQAVAKLERGGFVAIRGRSNAKTIALTAKGGKVSCSTVKLSPWTDDPYPGSQLSGCGCKRR